MEHSSSYAERNTPDYIWMPFEILKTNSEISENMLKNIKNNYYYGNDILERIREVR